jgi:hypothetical protein
MKAVPLLEVLMANLKLVVPVPVTAQVVPMLVILTR